MKQANKKDIVDQIKSINYKYYWIISFVLSSVVMYLFLGYSEVLSTGRYCILEGDLFEIYVPAIRQFWRNILNGESVYYSWSNSLGMNLSAYNLAYATGSLFNLLYLLLWKVDLAIVTGLVIVLKTGTVGACFTVFIQKVFKNKGSESILFSILYAMCAFQTMYNCVNMIWIDALYILPLLILAIVDFLRNGLWKKLVIIYAYLFIYNFYMAYILGIISFVFFVVYLCFFVKQNKFKKLLGYGGSVLLAIGISAVFLMPAAWFILNNRAEDSTVLIWNNTSVLDVYNQLFFGENNGRIGVYPYIYCGILSLLLLPMYFMNKKIHIKEKKSSFILLILSVLLCIVKPLYYFIHAFDAPDGWGFRFSFIISFLICTLGVRTFSKIKYIKNSYIIGIIILNIVVYISAMFYQNKTGFGGYTANTWLFFGINFGIMLVWGVVIGLLKKYSKNYRKRSSLIAIIFLFASVECICNGYLSYYKRNDTYPATVEGIYFAWRDNWQKSLDVIRDDDELYRIVSFDDGLINSDTYLGINGIADFSTTENVNVRNCLEALGVYSSARLIENYGISPATRMLLGVKYDVDVVDPWRILEVRERPMVTKNDYYLGMGFLVNPKLEDFSFESRNVFENINQLMSVMTDNEVELYSQVRDDEIEIREYGIHLREGIQNQMVLESQNGDDFVTIEYHIPYDERPAYSQFDCGSSQLISAMPYFYYGVENNIVIDGSFGVSYIKEMDLDENSYYVIIGMDPDTFQAVYYEYANFYYYNDDEYRRAYDIMKDNCLVVDNYKNGYIHGTISTGSDNNLLYTSIPYDKGWRLYVDGIKTDITPLLGNAFVGIKLSGAGEHVIEMKFAPPLLREGGILTGISLILFVGIWIFEKRKRKH